MAKFRKKPVVIDAVLWTGNNPNEVQHFASKAKPKVVEGKRLRIKTLEGSIYADPGDWIIRGVQGEFYPCKPDIFAQTYEAAEGRDDDAALRAEVERLLEVAEKVVDTRTCSVSILRAMNTARAALEGKP